ncbi:hypothetical protein HYS94_02490 [Candidatus Daviesbacteria bacterium]|nr:hypothetical protein [Candidatus Daviesbacteria bacterium]
MSEQVQRPPDKILRSVLEDEVDRIRQQGPEQFREFQQGAMANMEKGVPGLGRYLQQVIDQSPTAEEKDRIFEACYVFYHMRVLPGESSTKS